MLQYHMAMNSFSNLKNIKLLYLVDLRGFLNNSHITLRDIVKLYYTDASTVDTITREAEESSGEGLWMGLSRFPHIIYVPAITWATTPSDSWFWQIIQVQVHPLLGREAGFQLYCYQVGVVKTEYQNLFGKCSDSGHGTWQARGRLQLLPRPIC